MSDAEKVVSLKYGDGSSSRQVINKYTIRKPLNLTKPDEEDTYNSLDGETKTENKCLIMLHGGAWRDPDNTCRDFEDLIDYWREHSTLPNFVIYSIDYMLSKENGGQFPNLLIEILQAIETIKNDCREEKDDFDYYICGHSVGSTIITQILEHKDIFKNANIEYNFELPIFKKVFLLDGIYNIPLMLEEYPEYAFFVEEHFGSIEAANLLCNSVSNNKPLSADSLAQWTSLNEVAIIQSLEDELLSVKQSENMQAWLNSINCSLDAFYDDFGLHNDVYRNPRIAKIIYTYIK